MKNYIESNEKPIKNWKLADLHVESFDKINRMDDKELEAYLKTLSESQLVQILPKLSNYKTIAVYDYVIENPKIIENFDWDNTRLFSEWLLKIDNHRFDNLLQLNDSLLNKLLISLISTHDKNFFWWR